MKFCLENVATKWLRLMVRSQKAGTESRTSELYVFVAFAMKSAKHIVFAMAECGCDADMTLIHLNWHFNKFGVEGFVFGAPGDVVKASFAEAGPNEIVKQISVQCLNVRNTAEFGTVALVSDLGGPCEIFDSAKVALPKDTGGKKPAPPDPESDFEKWLRAGMDNLKGKRDAPPVDGTGGGRDADPVMPSFLEISDSDTDKHSAGEDDLPVNFTDMDLPPLPPPELPLPDQEEPPPPAPPAEPDPHVFLWLTRTGRKATCSTCGADITGGEFRCIYHPDPAIGRMDRCWQTMLWTYRHIDRRCLAPVVPLLRAAHAGRPRGAISSTATFLEAQGWQLLEDIGPLPKSSRETREARLASTADARQKLETEFAAAAFFVDSAI